MIDDIFVFDNVIHVYDLSSGNIRKDRYAESIQSRDQILGSVRRLRWPGVAMNEDPGFDWARRWETKEMYDLVFANSPTDMAMAQVVPMFDWFEDWYSPVKAQYEMARAYPDRVLFCGGVDPMYRGLSEALDQIDFQVKDLGACSFKFYNGHLRKSDCWRCDDEALAYPLYERMRDRGIKVLQFHKGNPFGQQSLEWLSPLDLQQAARDFPDMTFIVHHLALPYFEEMVSIAARFPNVYLSLAGYLTFYHIAPRRVLDHLGRLLQMVGADKILWGSEAALAGGPGPYLKAFMDLEMPEDLRVGYGYPQITREDKRKILGLNFARIMGVDVQAKMKQLAPTSAKQGGS